MIARLIALAPTISARVIALEAENATLRAEQAMLKFDIDKMLTQIEEHNAAWDELRASEAAALERVKVLEAALQEIAGEKFYPMGIGIEPTPTREAKMAAKALTPTADKE